MSPKILVVGMFHPDGFLRWLADGFAYAGCRVVRAGRIVGANGWPVEELPRIYEPPGFERRMASEGADSETAGAVLDAGAILMHYAERGLTADALVVEPWPGAVPGEDEIDAVARQLERLPAWALLGPTLPGGAKRAEVHGDGRYAGTIELEPAACPMTFWPGVGPREGILDADEVQTLYIGARADAFRRVVQFVARPDSNFQHRYEAALAGAFVGPVLDHQTWRHRAVTLLEAMGLEPGPMPRL